MPIIEQVTGAMQRARPLDYYWATADAEECVKQCCARRDAFIHYVSDTAYYSRICRNWEYYHGLFYDRKGDFGSEIRRAGEKFEKALIHSNHFRSFIHLLLTYTIQNRPAWDTRAVNSDNKSLLQAELGNHILDYYMEQMGLEMKMRQVLEHCLIFATGYLKCCWEDDKGQEIGADPDSLDIYHAGDLHFTAPTFFDVFFDFTVPYEQSQWVICRELVNKWDLIAKYPDKQDDILRAATLQNSKSAFDYYASMGVTDENSDNIILHSFYHDRTPAHPLGRYLPFVGEETFLYDGPTPYRRKPVHRIVPGDFLLTSLGYSPAFDLQGPQEALNMVNSTIITNQNNLGPTKVWFGPAEPINRADLEPGITALQSSTKPEVLNLCATAPEFFKSRDMWLQDMEYLSGINSVARGQPEASLKSGAALALIDSKAMQYASTLIQSYYTLLGEVGTEALYILKTKSYSPRTIAIAGQNMRSHLKEFWADEELELIDRVVVQSGNPLMRTTAGRKEVAAELLQNGLITTPEEYLTVLNTGQTKPLTEQQDAQLQKVHAENEILRQGISQEEMLASQLGAPPVLHAAMDTDNHVLHIRKHSAILDSPESYGNPLVATPVLAAIAEHALKLQDPQIQILMVLLGYPSPLMGMGGPGGEDKGSPTNGTQNKPKQEKKQVPGAPPIPGSPNGGDQSQIRGSAA